MKTGLMMLLCVAAAVSVSCAGWSGGSTWEWRRIAPLPDPLGVAMPFAGVAGDTLVVAGGANFPDGPPWEGGKKVWHDRVWTLDRPEGAWREAGRLPRPLGYGVSINGVDGLICIGGSDEARHHPQVFEIRVEGDGIVTRDLADLPGPVANACGASIGSRIYIAGGTRGPDSTEALDTFLEHDLAEEGAGWRALATWPGPPRFLATAAAHEGRFYLIGGAELSADGDGKPKRRYLSDAYCFTPGAQAGQGTWRRIAGLPRPCVAAPSPAPVTGKGGFLILGGDDGSLADFRPVKDHPGFPAEVLAYEAARDRWVAAGKHPAPRVTQPTTPWLGGWALVSGEVRPGVRSPEAWMLTPRETWRRFSQTH